MIEIPEEKYKILEEIGRGGSASVYKAWNKALNCYVAVKVYEDSKKWIAREKELLKELRHPAFPVIMDYIESEEGIYLIMEYIEGMNLERYIEKKGPVGKEQAVIWAVELADSLAYLHNRSKPVIYQDMKPSNIIVNEKGEVKLVDFGSVYLKYQENQKDYVFMGTYGYAAPEQFGRKARDGVDERSDIYGLGATLHHMLTGNNPSKPPYLMRPLRSYNAALSKDLEKIVDKATAVRKERRYQNILEMRDALKMTTGREKITGKLCMITKILYYTMLFGMGTVFLRLCRTQEMDMQSKSGLLVLSAHILLLCIAKELIDKVFKRNKRRIRQIKSIYLSIKKGRGLPAAVICGVLTGVLLSMTGVKAAKEEVFPVIIRNEEGRKILIHFDAVYCPEEDMRLEIPKDSLISGEEYILRLECINKRTKEKRSRTFYLKGSES